MKKAKLGLCAALIVSMLCACSNTQSSTPTTAAPSTEAQTTAAATEAPATEAPAAAYEMDAEASITLKATGMCTYSFAEEQEEAWADAVTALYLREMPADPAGTPLTDADLVDEAKYTASTTKIIMDSDLFPVDPSTNKEYEVTVKAEGYDDYHIDLTVKNLRPNEFVVRSIAADGSVTAEKTFTYAEMEAMCTTEAYTSAACVMHGLNNYHVIGVELTSLLEAAGIEFKEGMSMACRVADAAAEIKATEVNNGNPTGEVLQNPEQYWIKPRYTGYYKMTYENLLGRTRYFVSAPYDNEELGKMLAEDGAAWSIDARIKLAESGLYTECKPMIAIQYESFEYNTDPRDPRSNTDTVWELSKNERGFAFVFGLAMDDDPTVNTCKYDDEAKEYPIVTDTSYAGKEAIEEGPDACGTSARQAKLVFGIDIFEDGSLN